MVNPITIGSIKGYSREQWGKEQLKTENRKQRDRKKEKKT